MGGGMNFYQQAQLQNLIQRTIEPDSWLYVSGGGAGGIGGVGGAGGIGGVGGAQGMAGTEITDAEGRGEMHFFRSTQMVVFQTPKVHQQIEELLKLLRGTHGTQVSIEIRFLSISNNFLEDIGLDIDILLGAGNAGFSHFSEIPIDMSSHEFTSPPPATGISGSLGGGAVPDAFSISGQFLDNIQVDFLMRATQAHQRSRNLVAPHVTVMNGETSMINFSKETAYVASATSNVGYGVGLYDIQPAIDVSGIQIMVTPVITADKRYVLLNANFQQQITESIEKFNTGTGASGVDLDTSDPIEPGDVQSVVIQQPVKSINSITTHVMVPDGGTLLLGGQKIVGERERESGVPTLSKLPLINRLFNNRAVTKDENVLLILLKPQIILQSEREEDEFGSILTKQE